MRLIKVELHNSKISNFLFDLRNKSYVKKNSMNTKNLKLYNHKKWFKKFLNGKNMLYLITKKKVMIGYIRLEKIRRYYNVSWAILKKYQKMGFTKKSLILATKNKKCKYKALIKKSNIESIYIAEKAKFKRKYIKKDILYYFK